MSEELRRLRAIYDIALAWDRADSNGLALPAAYRRLQAALREHTAWLAEREKRETAYWVIKDNCCRYYAADTGAFVWQERLRDARRFDSRKDAKVKMADICVCHYPHAPRCRIVRVTRRKKP